ncbi:MAG: hypothetical protein FGM28_09090 [Limnohabitans sp.]|nr:hypothetical protein [Limnohabitans sp.]
MRVILVDGPTTLALLQELIPLSKPKGVSVNVAWVRPNRLIPTLQNHPSRIRTLRFGMSFHHTHPATIEELLRCGVPCQVVQPQPPQVFHPKEYYLLGRHWSAAIIGSSNLTPGGLGGTGNWTGNIESSLFLFIGQEEVNMPQTKAVLESAVDTNPLTLSEPIHSGSQIVARWIDQSAAYEGLRLSADHPLLKKYRAEFNAAQKAKGDASLVRRQAMREKLSAVESGWLLNLRWPQYLELLRQTPEELAERIQILHATQDILLKANHQFTAIENLNDRLAIGGSRASRDAAVDPLDWRLFGNMQRAADGYDALLQHPNAHQSAQLNRLSDGRLGVPLTPNEADEVMRALRCNGVKTARITRLMSMLRPAEFVVMTQRNTAALAVGIGLARITPPSYLTTVIPRLRQTHWFLQKPRSTWDPETLAVWRYRMALVDMLVY